MAVSKCFACTIGVILSFACVVPGFILPIRKPNLRYQRNQIALRHKLATHARLGELNACSQRVDGELLGQTGPTMMGGKKKSRFGNILKLLKQKKQADELSSDGQVDTKSTPTNKSGTRMQVSPAEVEAVIAFRCRYGELPKRNGVRMEGKENQMARFLCQQRQDKKSGKLSPDRVAQLERIPGFEWDPNEVAFKESVRAIVAFCTKHGGLPKRHGERMEGEERRLAQFLSDCRQDRKSGKLMPYREAQLERIPGFEWDPNEVAFKENVRAVIAFCTKYGGLPRLHGERMEGEEHLLSKFLSRQKQDKKSSKLSPDRAALLRGIPGFGWDPRELNSKKI